MHPPISWKKEKANEKDQFQFINCRSDCQKVD
jgi:hypothetical protein